MRKFATGATRDDTAGKIDYDGFLSPYALERFGQYMEKHQHTPLGLRQSDNWQKGIPLDAYRKSLWRHFFEAWKLARSAGLGAAIEEALCGVIFNAQGWLHEIVKARLTAVPQPSASRRPAKARR